MTEQWVTIIRAIFFTKGLVNADRARRMVKRGGEIDLDVLRCLHSLHALDDDAYNAAVDAYNERLDAEMALTGLEEVQTDEMP